MGIRGAGDADADADEDAFGGLRAGADADAAGPDRRGFGARDIVRPRPSAVKNTLKFR